MSDSRFVRLISIPKSFYVSGKLVGWRQAFHLPIMVRYNCVLNDLSGHVDFGDSPIRYGMLYIGFSSTGIFDPRYSRSIIELSGVLKVKGKGMFGQGSRISIAKTGVMTIGDGFSSTAEGTFVCANRISIGEGTAMAWSAMIMDTDWHSTMNTETGELYQAAGEVTIGKHCWLGTRSMVVKDSLIPDGCILAANSTATKKYPTPNTLLAGTPAVEKKHNITKSTKGDFQFL